MKNKTFYGKELANMKPHELQLLGVDLNISALVKGGNKNPIALAQGFKLRTELSNECINYGGNYSREDFLNDTGFVDDFSMEEVKEMAKKMNDFEKGLKGMIKGMLEEGKHRGNSKENVDEPHNGRKERGFEMN